MGCAQYRSWPSSIVWDPRSDGISAVRRPYQQPRWRASGSGVTRSLGLLGNVAWRERRAFTEEKIFHVFGDEILRFLLPRHQAVLVEDHLHAILPELPRVGGDVVVDPLAELAGPRWCVETREFLLELHAHHLPAAFVAGRRPCTRCMPAVVSHDAIVAPGLQDRWRTRAAGARHAARDRHRRASRRARK